MKEFRCLIFNKHEALTAIIDRRKRLREPLPVGTIRDITYQNHPEDGVVSNIEVIDDYGRCENLYLGAAEMAAALVDYCINRRIPFPAGSKKWIEVLNEGELTLLLTIDTANKKKKNSKPLQRATTRP